eukprot:CAMPEP_0114350434 /NCGR_PEP_ID=MMETSP0101-20121206/16351_1 /TAXON_ID=38822 ORGANISM="Pteridomonas danica, Strain PT" /NCGR_SAMPLE_ID=MMETSP0101 /ASSEMBLY_ACC=CAM_ASM_000211 /LENGTH=239 /DNA_ID=CAMNT_0001489649 /DNA_START=1260 /DNA_END=1979 /DNA_ORIENTATION=+
MIWFSGLPGAISFALSQSMPGKHHDLFVTTTLSVVIFSTVVMGGLTAPMLTCTGMRSIDVGLSAEKEALLTHDLDEDNEYAPLVPKSTKPLSPITLNGDDTTNKINNNHNNKTTSDMTTQANEGESEMLDSSQRGWSSRTKKDIRSSWRDFEDRYIKPTFGGSSCEPPSPSPLFAKTVSSSSTSSSSSSSHEPTASSTALPSAYMSHRKIDHRTTSSSSSSSVTSPSSSTSPSTPTVNV